MAAILGILGGLAAVAAGLVTAAVITVVTLGDVAPLTDDELAMVHGVSVTQGATA